jgi:hypothetical protein
MIATICNYNVLIEACGLMKFRMKTCVLLIATGVVKFSRQELLLLTATSVVMCFPKTVNLEKTASYKK